MKIKLIIWDLDGLLVDSLPRSIDNFRQVINSRIKKQKVSQREVYNHYLGPTEKDDVLKLAASRDIPESEYKTIRKEFIALKKQNLKRIKIFPGMDKIILYAEEKNIIQVLITGRDLASAKTILSNGHTTVNGKSMLTYFDYFLGGDQYPGKKKAFAMMQEKYKIASDAILVLGDELKDIDCARQLGFVEGACLWGSIVKSELKNLNPTKIFASPMQVLRFLRQ